MPTTELVEEPTTTAGVDLNRRNFVRAAVGSGFASAVLPVTAQAIKTDSTGLTVGEKIGRAHV